MIGCDSVGFIALYWHCCNIVPQFQRYIYALHIVYNLHPKGTFWRHRLRHKLDLWNLYISEQLRLHDDDLSMTITIVWDNSVTLLRRGGHSSRAWKRGNALTLRDRLGGRRSASFRWNRVQRNDTTSRGVSSCILTLRYKNQIWHE